MVRRDPEPVNAEKKRIEAYVLAAARNAGVPIPTGETPDEEPDFRFNDETPALGIELSEVLRPASSNGGILPVAEESFHSEIITKAQLDYYNVSDAKPVHVNVYFTNTRGKKRSKAELTRSLTEFVKANVPLANRFVVFYRPETPDGIGLPVVSNTYPNIRGPRNPVLRSEEQPPRSLRFSINLRHLYRQYYSGSEKSVCERVSHKSLGSVPRSTVAGAWLCPGRQRVVIQTNP